MVDIHSHIVYNVDDGSKSIAMTREILKEAENAGFTDIICTPHFKENVFETSLYEIDCKIKAIKEEVIKDEINVNIYSGNENFLIPNMYMQIIYGKCRTLNNTNYVLVELPFTNEILYAKHEFQMLIENGYIPILAHPERYFYVQKDISYLDKFLKMGVKLQCNYASIIGYYGKKAKKTIKKLLKMDLISFMGADVHRPETIYCNMDKILKKLKKYTTPRQLRKITYGNAKKYIIDGAKDIS